MDGSGANTLAVNGAYGDTLVQWNQGDKISIQPTITVPSPMSVLISHVDLNVAPDYVNNIILDVSPALQNSGMVSLTGQQVTPGLVNVGSGQGGYINTSDGKPWDSTLSLAIDQVPTLKPANVDYELQVIYDGSNGTTYASNEFSVQSGDDSLSVSPAIPDNQHPGHLAVPLTWSVPTVTAADGVTPIPADRILGYTVQYQCVAYQEDPANPGQPLLDANGNPVLASETLDGNGNAVPLTDGSGNSLSDSSTPVSYTHLTLPTKRIV